MKRGLFGFILLLLVFAAIACGKNSAPTNTPSAEKSSGFELDGVRGTASLPLSLAAAETASGYEIGIDLSAEAEANDVFFKVKYDPAAVSPAGVDFHGALGESIDLAITSVPGEVAVGTSRIREAGDGPVRISGVIATLRFENRAFDVERRVSGLAPVNADNKVTDLIASVAGDQVTLTWTEKNLGDYDNSGEVGIPDITPIALNYLRNSGTIMELVDGDKSGEVGISDITPIALNYGNSIAGYRVNSRRDGSWTMIQNPTNPGAAYTVNRPSAPPQDSLVRYEFIYTLEAGDEENFQTQPVGPDNSTGIVSNATAGGGVSIPAPPRIEDLTARGGPDLGDGVIELTWTTPDDPHLDRQNVWWEKGGDGTNLIPYNQNVPPTADSLLITGCEPGETYHFRVWGTNFNEFGMRQDAPASNSASALAFSPAGIPVINDLSVLSDVTTGNGNIKLMWTVPSDPYLHHFEILWQEGGDGSNLTVLDDYVSPTASEYMVTGCSEGPRYFFKIKAAYDGYVGQPSNMVSSTAFPTPNIPPLEITSVTRNRTTFMTGEAINLGVTTNLDAEFASDLVYEWSVASGPGNITGGASSKNATAGVTAKGTVTFQVRVTVNGAPGLEYDKTATVKVIGTTLGPAIKVVDTTNPAFLFNGWNFFAQANEDANDYYNQQHVVMLNMWATWCGPCLAEFPRIYDMNQRLTAEGEDFFLVTLDFQFGSDTKAAHDTWLTNSGYQYAAAFFENNSAAANAYMGMCASYGFSPGYIPTNFLMDRDGYVRAGQNAVPDPITGWENKVRELLGEDFE